MLSFLAGKTVGDTKPWPAWVHSNQALLEVGGWLRRYHDTVASFIPPQGASWRGSPRAWRPGDIIGHTDAAPYNAVWQETTAKSHAQASVDSSPTGRLVGFIDWDFAAPCPPIWDLAFVASAWVPLHARDVAAAEGFTRFADRPHRLRLLLDSYQYSGTLDALLDAVRARVQDHIRSVRESASSGDPAFIRLIADGVLDRLNRALAELDADADFLRADPHD